MEKLKQDIRAQFGLTLSPRQVDAFQLYEQELMDWNTRFNLTAIREGGKCPHKHFLDL
jgi:16S rRNA (guanine527-N7)-methyltransferase